jgi:hypothetical protein
LTPKKPEIPPQLRNSSDVLSIPFRLHFSHSIVLAKAITVYEKMKRNEKGMNNMEDISSLVAALAVLGIIRVCDAAEEERTSRRAEVFVPFNLPPLPPREQPMHQPETDTAVAASAPCVPTTV